MLSLCSIGTRVGLIFFLSALAPLNFSRDQNLIAVRPSGNPSLVVNREPLAVGGELILPAPNSDIGTALNGPNIDYASIAKGYGLYAEGPITDPKDLGPALKRAIARVKAGEPALLDVVTQPR